jgi:hypothetical protein
MQLCRLAALALLVLSANVAWAQASDDNPYGGWHPSLAGGLHFFGPPRVSIALGGGLRREESSASDRSRMIFAFLEPGLGGSRASVGYAETVGASGGGWSLRASLLKLTNEPRRRTMGGIELQVIPLYCAGARVGAFRELARGEIWQTPIPKRRTVFLADLSLCL